MLYEDHEGSRAEFLRLLAENGEEPAFVIRRRKTDSAVSCFFEECHRQQVEMLYGPRLQLRQLESAIGGDWRRLSPHLVADDSWKRLRQLHQTFDSDSPPPAWASYNRWSGQPAKSLRQFYQSVQRFNSDWCRYLNHLDRSSINQIIRDFNDYYLLEKSCAMGREDLAARGFEPLQPITAESLLCKFPTVELPGLRDEL
ncbi:hypothetical protein NHH03_11235 [Stieleria sp. TO1_6]|uniref:hypothetical protein n=1 Tax=Stieleria tagensis TaxID=2956795 RepID=UPI00209B42DA|nr:hypothetical protein [Stieleria tagensis]MCO8122314.1 hypothetical protein [Stieleria tagensis]